MALPDLPHKTRFTVGRQLLPGSRLNCIDDQLNSYQEITALAGGTLTAATPVINASNVSLQVVATGGDSVVLPPAKTGLKIAIVNNGAAAAQIFGNGTDTINATAGNVGVSLANGAAIVLVCIKNGNWRRFVSA